MSSRRRWRRVAPLVSAAALVAVSCGGGGAGASAGRYVAAVCKAVSDIDSASREAAQDVQSATQTSGTLEDAKSVLVSQLDEYRTSVERVVGTLNTLGPPSVPNGAQIHRQIVDAFTALDTAAERAATSAGDLSTQDPASFADGAQSVGRTITASIDAVPGANIKESPELERAAEQDDTCLVLS